MQELCELVESESWKRLLPNYPSPEALLPGNLTAEQIDFVVEQIASHFSKRPDAKDFAWSEVEGLGNLKEIGKGEAKVAYLLTTKDGKKIVFKVGGYDGRPQIPQDPRLVKFMEGLGKNFWSYSDLRTYLCLPLHINNRSFGIVLQEYGGNQHITNELDPRMKLAKRKARQYIKSKGLVVAPDMGEFRHPRHYFLNQGSFHLPAITDIPVQEIKGHRD